MTSPAIHHGLDNLRVADVATFLTVYKLGSVTASARQIGVTTSQVSKAITRLEAYLKISLLDRHGRCVTPTGEANAMIGELEALVRRARQLSLQRATRATVAIGAPSYLATASLPKLAEVLGDVHLRAIEAVHSLRPGDPPRARRDPARQRRVPDSARGARDGPRGGDDRGGAGDRRDL